MRKIHPIYGKQIVPGLPIYAEANSDGHKTVYVGCYKSSFDEFWTCECQSYELCNTVKVRYKGLTTFHDVLKLTMQDGSQKWLTWARKKIEPGRRRYKYSYVLKDHSCAAALKFWKFVKDFCKENRGYRLPVFLGTVLVRYRLLTFDDVVSFVDQKSDLILVAAKRKVHVTVNMSSLFKGKRRAYIVQSKTSLFASYADSVSSTRGKLVATISVQGGTIVYTFGGKRRNNPQIEIVPE